MIDTYTHLVSVPLKPKPLSPLSLDHPSLHLIVHGRGLGFRVLFRDHIHVRVPLVFRSVPALVDKYLVRAPWSLVAMFVFVGSKGS